MGFDQVYAANYPKWQSWGSKGDESSKVNGKTKVYNSKMSSRATLTYRQNGWTFMHLRTFMRTYLNPRVVSLIQITHTMQKLRFRLDHPLPYVVETYTHVNLGWLLFQKVLDKHNL